MNIREYWTKLFDSQQQTLTIIFHYQKEDYDPIIKKVVLTGNDLSDMQKEHAKIKNEYYRLLGELVHNKIEETVYG